MRLSFSRVDTYKTCPYRFDLRYNKGMVTFEKKDNTNALYLGTALHMAIEKSPEEAVEWYLSQFPISTDEIIEEAMKLSAMGEKAHNLVQNISRAPVFEKNVFVHDNGFDFLGFIDCLMPIRPGHWAMLDFKYSSNVEHYSESPQLPIYKHYFEKMTGERIDMMAYLICPKIGIRRKDGEDTESFRLRLREEMEKPEWKPMLIPVENSEGAIEFWYEDVHKLMTATEFPKKEGKLCWWCDYREYCQDGSTVNLMEENDMRMMRVSPPICTANSLASGFSRPLKTARRNFFTSASTISESSFIPSLVRLLLSHGSRSCTDLETKSICLSPPTAIWPIGWKSSSDL